MATNSLSTEAIALTEKKMDMTLDDIIKMSKKTSFKGKQATRTSNKSQGLLSDHAAQRNSKIQRFLNSKSSIRQGMLAQRRTNFKVNQFQVTTEAARKAAVAPIRKRVFNPNKQSHRAVNAPMQRSTGDGNFSGKEKQTTVNKQKPKTLDALFAGMKEERFRTMSHQVLRQHGQSAGSRRGRGRGRQQQRGRFGHFA